MMTPHIIITIVGLAILIIYIVVKLLEFYGIQLNQYGSYILFYVFLLLTYFILPHGYQSPP